MCVCSTVSWAIDDLHQSDWLLQWSRGWHLRRILPVYNHNAVRRLFASNQTELKWNQTSVTVFSCIIMQIYAVITPFYGSVSLKGISLSFQKQTSTQKPPSHWRLTRRSKQSPNRHAERPVSAGASAVQGLAEEPVECPPGTHTNPRGSACSDENPKTWRAATEVGQDAESNQSLSCGGHCPLRNDFQVFKWFDLPQKILQCTGLLF